VDHLGARLLAWPLLGQHELTAREVSSRRREQHGDLQREDVLSVEVLMQAIVVALVVSKKQRRRPGLTGSMATLEEGDMITRITDGSVQGLAPAVRDAGKRRIERGPKLRDDVGQWIGEVLVFAPPEPMLRHHDPAPEPLLDRVGLGERPAL